MLFRSYPRAASPDALGKEVRYAYLPERGQNWYKFSMMSASFSMPIKNERSGRLKGIRLDVALVERGLSPSRERAQAPILAGVVRVDGETERRSSRAVSPSQTVSVDAPPRYVSRGGYKLEKALDTFAVDPSGLVALDAGASTGGFTDCLLQRNCARVYAVDVGYGQIDYRLREDARVVVLERTNVRYLEHLPEPVDLVVADVSFISLRLVIPSFVRLSAPGAPILTLIDRKSTRLNSSH